MTAQASRGTPYRLESATIPVWVASVELAEGGVAYGRGQTLDGVSVDFVGEPRALWAVCTALETDGGPVLAAVSAWWSVLRHQLPGEPEVCESDLADWLRARMRERQLSQRQVAWRAGVDHATVSRLLSGRVPTVATLARLARVLGWPPFDAVDRSFAARGPDLIAEGASAA